MIGFTAGFVLGFVFGIFAIAIIWALIVAREGQKAARKREPSEYPPLVAVGSQGWNEARRGR